MIENKKIIRASVPLGCAVIILCFIFVFPNFSRLCELKVYDLKMRSTAKLSPLDKNIAGQIKIINVSDSTINTMGWPKASHHARMINILSKHKASLIVYDWIFHQPTKTLVRAVKDSKRFLTPLLFGLSPDKGYPEEKYPQNAITLLENSRIIAEEVPPGLWQTTTATSSHFNILQYSLGTGHISSSNDEGNPLNDGVFRKVALVVNFAGRIIPSLSLQAACKYLNVPLSNIRIIPGKEIILPQAVSPDTLSGEDFHIPINEQGEMWVYFPGRWEENYFEPFWFENMLKQHKDQTRWPEYDRKFSGKICLVGNASGKSRDTHLIPMEDNFPGVGIHAGALFTILSKNFIRFSGPLGEVLIILAVALAMGLVSIRKQPLFILQLLLLAGYVALTFWVFGQYRYNLPTLFPALTILLSAIAGLALYSTLEQRGRKNLLKEKQYLLGEYNDIQASLENKDRELRKLALQHKEQAEDKDKNMGVIEQEKKDLLIKLNALDDKLKNKSIHPDTKYVPLEEIWERLRIESLKAGIISRNKIMLENFNKIKKAARCDKPVLILGEPGTGKELVARAIHQLSNRKDREILIAACTEENLSETELFGETGTDKPGLLAQADKGTIFLDEIMDIPAAVRSKLFGALKSYTPDSVACKTDARVVAATARNIQEAIKSGEFKEDLYYFVVHIELPPLRERKDDIEDLCKYFMETLSPKDKPVKKMSQKAMEALTDYDWRKGNIAQLKNVIERALVLTEGELITEPDITFIPFEDRLEIKPYIHKASYEYLCQVLNHFLGDTPGGYSEMDLKKIFGRLQQILEIFFAELSANLQTHAQLQYEFDIQPEEISQQKQNPLKQTKTANEVANYLLGCDDNTQAMRSLRESFTEINHSNIAVFKVMESSLLALLEKLNPKFAQNKSWNVLKSKEPDKTDTDNCPKNWDEYVKRHTELLENKNKRSEIIIEVFQKIYPEIMKRAYAENEDADKPDDMT